MLKCSAFNDYKFTGYNNHDYQRSGGHEDHLLVIIDKHQSIFPMSCLIIVGDHKYAAEQEQGDKQTSKSKSKSFSAIIATCVSESWGGVGGC